MSLLRRLAELQGSGMPDWRAEIRARLTPLGLSAQREVEIAEEWAQHLEDRYADWRARGRTDADALRLTREELAGDGFADLVGVRPPADTSATLAGAPHSGRLWADLWRDVRYGARSLRRTPGFTTLAALTLALGIGATTAMFSVLNAVLLRPLPFPQPENLLRLYQTYDKAEGGIGSFSLADFLAVHDDGRAYASVATVMTPRDGFSVVLGGRAERVFGTVVSADFFATLGVHAVLGRGFQPGDDAPGAPPTVVLGHGFWQRQLGGDPAILGKQLEIQGAPTTVIGVMPAGVWYPRSDVADIWLNEVLVPPTRRGPFGWQVIARVRPGVSAAQRQFSLDQAAAYVRTRFPGGPDRWTFVERPLTEQFTRGLRPALVVLMAAVVLVLVIACVNVTNLLLARATTREHEIAVRTALGASRSRIIRQLLVESLVLATLGGAGGVAIATWSVRALVAAAPATLATLRDLDVSVDGRALLLACAVSIGSVLLFGTAPALMTALGGTQPSIGHATRGGTDGVARRRFRSALVGAEFALSLLLLITAGLLVRSLAKLRSADTGIRADGVVTASIALPTVRYATPAQVLTFHDRLLGQFRGVPGVRSASASVGLPPDVFGNQSDFFPTRDALPAGAFSPVADFLCVDGDYFATLGIPVLAGRPFDSRDNANAPQTVIVSAELGRRYFPHTNPLGQRLSVGGRGPANEYTIVGVVGDVPYDGVARGASVAMYFPFAQFSQGTNRSFSVVVRATADVGDIGAEVRHAVQAIDPELAVARIRSATDLLDASVASDRFRTTLLGMFALLAVILAAIGIYGVMAFSVGRRAREIGVRIAMGAQAPQVYRQILREGLRVAGLGIATGLVAAFATTHIVSSFLFGVSPTDPLTFGVVPAVLLLIAACACLVPAHRATRVDPAITMVSD